MLPVSAERRKVDELEAEVKNLKDYQRTSQAQTQALKLQNQELQTKLRGIDLSYQPCQSHLFVHMFIIHLFVRLFICIIYDVVFGMLRYHTFLLR